jgi:hypothetical protein
MQNNVSNHPHEQVVYCETAKRLLQEFSQAVQAALKLHEQHFAAILAGDLDGEEFDSLILEAIEARQNAKYAYLHHVKAHDCSSVGGNTKELRAAC